MCYPYHNLNNRDTREMRSILSSKTGLHFSTTMLDLIIMPDTANTITYEQPLNELIRACLRLEQLFCQIDDLLFSPDAKKHSHLLVCHIIYVLNILDRPDLKSKFGQEFNRHIEYFNKLKTSPDIRLEKLEKTLNQLSRLKTYFLDFPGKLGNDIRDNEFMSQIRLNLLSHSGGSLIDAPSYYRWLQEPIELRQHDIHTWLKSFHDIKLATDLILDIVRNSNLPTKKIAEKGFYHQALNTALPCQLIRVELPTMVNIFPEISAGRHRLSIRFLIPNTKTRAQQTTQNIDFQLTCCVI